MNTAASRRRNNMERPTNPFRKGGMPWQVMEMALQGEFDGLPGTSDLTRVEMAEILGTEIYSINNAIVTIKKKTGYIVPYVKMRPGKNRGNNGG